MPGLSTVLLCEGLLCYAAILFISETTYGKIVKPTVEIEYLTIR